MRKICKVTLNNEPYLANCGDLLLDWALMNGVELPHDCRSGICGACRVRLVEGTVFGGHEQGAQACGADSVRPYKQERRRTVCDRKTCDAGQGGDGSGSGRTSAHHDEIVGLGARYGWEMAGAWKTAMVDYDECILLWAIPTWKQWAAFEKAQTTDPDVRTWRAAARDLVESWQRIVLVDAPLSPFRTGRQPTRADRTPEAPS